MTTAPAHPPHRPAGQAILVVGLLAVALGGGFALFRRKPEGPPRPAFGAFVHDEALDVPAAGVSRRLRVPEPSTLEIAIAPAAGATVKASFGPAQPAERSPVDAPDPEHTTTWTARAGDPPHVQVTLVPGHYVLRLVPEADAAAGLVGLRVRSRGAK